jgi:trigger factor
MPYTLTPRVNHTVELTAHLDPDVVERERLTIADRVRRKAHVPGFRPGRAPLDLVRTRFAQEIQEELEGNLADAVWREVLDGEQELRPLTAPRVQASGLENDGSFHYRAAVEVRPRYDLPTEPKLSLPELSLEVAAAEVESELERIRGEHATWEPADEAPAADGIMVEAALHGEVVDGDGEPYEEETARFVLGDPDLPVEIGAALQGALPGETRVAERRFPDGHANPRIAGKTVSYRIAVRGLKRRVLPASDDDLARTVGLDSEQALRERLREALAARKRGERRQSWRRALLDQLESQLDPGDLPPSLVSAAVHEDLNRFAYTMAMQGHAPKPDEVNWQELAARIEPGVRRRVLDDLVLEQLAEAWKIGVPQAVVEAVIRDEAERLGVPPAEHRANLAKEHRLEELRHAARLSAVADELIRRAGGEVEP